MYDDYKFVTKQELESLGEQGCIESLERQHILLYSRNFYPNSLRFHCPLQRHMKFDNKIVSR